MSTDCVVWTSSRDLRRQVQRLWDKGHLLATLVADEAAFFPRRLVLKTPGSREMSERFTDVRDWIRDLQQARGLRLEMKSLRHPSLGHNNVPASVWLDSLQQAAAILGKQHDVKQFAEIVTLTRQRHPALLIWLQAQPLKALSLVNVWSSLLDIIDWLSANPAPGIYLRQVDLAGIDSKFIEGHRGILSTLLDLSLPERQINQAARGISQFELRYGFRPKPQRIRFRILDADLNLLPGRDQDISLTAADFRCLGEAATIKYRLRRVFMTENEINFLSFPRLPNSLVLFGAGYGFDALADIPWLSRLEVYYWGDIDTHGFAILDQLRARLPGAKSLLMDAETRLAHRPFWERESKPVRHHLHRLSTGEQRVYRDLCDNRDGENLRLEQEKIGFRWLQAALAHIRGCGS